LFGTKSPANHSLLSVDGLNQQLAFKMMQHSPSTDGAELSAADRQAVDAYVSYRMKLSVNPAAAPTDPPTRIGASAALREAADSVLRKENDLLQIRIDNAEDELASTLEEKESVRMALMRFRDAAKLETEKIHACAAFDSIVDEIVYAERRKITAEQSSAAAVNVINGHAVEHGDARGADQFAQQQSEAVASGLIDTPANVALHRGRLHDALASSTDACPTVIYPEIMTVLSELVRSRCRMQYERTWSDNTAAEFVAMQEKMTATSREEEQRQLRVKEAKQMLDDAHRDVFRRRKQFILTHRRLFGIEPLPNGTALQAAATVDLVASIRTELEQGRSDTLMRLSDSECTALMSDDSHQRFAKTVDAAARDRSHRQQPSTSANSSLAPSGARHSADQSSLWGSSPIRQRPPVTPRHPGH
jgi:hypothetical protein